MTAEFLGAMANQGSCARKDSFGEEGITGERRSSLPDGAQKEPPLIQRGWGPRGWRADREGVSFPPAAPLSHLGKVTLCPHRLRRSLRPSSFLSTLFFPTADFTLRETRARECLPADLPLLVPR